MPAPAPRINQVARDKQDGLVKQAVDALKQGQDVLLVAPTGSGKTYIGNRIVAEMNAANGDTAVMLQTRKRIAVQNDAKAAHSGIDAGQTAVVLNGEIGNAAQASVVYALPQTLADRPGAIGRRDLVAVDEVHRLLATGNDERDQGKEMQRVIADLEDRNPNLRMLGMTASPYPAEGNSLHPRMQNATRITLTYSDAIDAGMITKIKTVTPNYPLTGSRWLHGAIEEKINDRDIDKTRAGLQSMIRAGRTDGFMDFAVRMLRENGLADKPTLGFADRIDEATALTRAMQDAGMTAGMIHSRMSQKDINATIAAYEEGRITKLNSVDMIGEGFDAPNTAAVLVTKAMMSRTEYIQIAGRAQRALAGKDDGLMIDLGASTAIYGSLEEFRKTQQFLTHPERPGELKPWLTLTKEPYVRALVTGRDVHFAVAIANPANPRETGYHIVRSFENRTTGLRQLEHVRPNLMSGRDLTAFAREQIERNETAFMALRTRRVVQETPGGERREFSRAAMLAAGIYTGQREPILQMAYGKPIGLAAAQRGDRVAEGEKNTGRRPPVQAPRPARPRENSLGL